MEKGDLQQAVRCAAFRFIRSVPTARPTQTNSKRIIKSQGDVGQS
jgi:hypothetical protein